MEKKKVKRKIYNKGDFVVYPSYGLGKIKGIQNEIIGGKRIKVFIISINERVILRIPAEKINDLGLRKLSSKDRMKSALSILEGKSKKKKKIMWSRRAQEYDQKINSGKLYRLAEVVKDLNKKTDVIAEQSYSERQLFEKAYERLKSEFEVILGEKAKIKMDKALKRLDIPAENEA